jgi:hypothetical protein
MKIWKLDPKKTARENLWSAAIFAADCFRQKYAKAGMKLSKEEWQDALDDIVLAAVRAFMNKVNRGEINMEYSFYQNVYSCVYSVFNMRLDHFLRNVVKRKMDNIDRLEPEHAQFLVDTTKKPMYISGDGDRKTARSNLKSWLSKSCHLTHLVAEWVYDFFMYVESCEATGIPVDKMNPMYILGAPYATGEIVKGVKMIIIRDSIEGDAVFGSLLVGGFKVCDTLENRKKLIPCGEYSLNVSKSPKFGRMLPLVYNDEVPMHRGIRIHVGNSAKDSSGCILVGFGRNGDRLVNSRNAESAVTGLAANDAKLIITTSWLIKGDMK